MKRRLCVPLILFGLALAACSGSDDSAPAANNPDVSQLLGKWVITKAVYEGNADTTYYQHSGSCGREVLEFHSNKTVEETLYVDSNCQNGAGTEFDWWTSGSGFKMGYENSDAAKFLSISGSELSLDGWEEWGYKKYYLKVN